VNGTSGTNGSSGSSGLNGNLVETKSITVESPTASENIPMFFSFSAVTVKQVQAVVAGTTPSVTMQLTYGTDNSVAGTGILTAATAITNTTTGQNFNAFANPNITAVSWVKLITSASSGTITYLQVSIIYQKN
jgi:hypothetical protein